jgi:hypothetical protein
MRVVVLGGLLRFWEKWARLRHAIVVVLAFVLTCVVSQLGHVTHGDKVGILAQQKAAADKNGREKTRKVHILKVAHAEQPHTQVPGPCSTAGAHAKSSQGCAQGADGMLQESTWQRPGREGRGGNAGMLTLRRQTLGGEASPLWPFGGWTYLVYGREGLTQPADVAQSAEPQDQMMFPGGMPPVTVTKKDVKPIPDGASRRVGGVGSLIEGERVDRPICTAPAGLIAWPRNDSDNVYLLQMRQVTSYDPRRCQLATSICWPHC